MAAPVRLGLVGCGRIAERGYLPAARDLSGVEFVAFADPDFDRARDVSHFDPAIGRSKWDMRSESPVFATVDGLVETERVDGLVVATPAELHVEAAELAARAGIPSLVEKPPAPDLVGAMRLAALDPAPALAFNRRFLQGVELAPRVPAEGWLELDLELSFRRGGWGAHVCRDEALLDAGTHLIDLAAFLADSTPIAVRDAAIAPERASLELELGRARARIRCATDGRYAERIEVRDRAGGLLAANRIGAIRGRAARLRGAPDPLVRSLRRQLEAFAAAIRGEDRGALAGPADGVATMATIEAARRSAELGGAEVTVALPDLAAAR
ncbi:MAG TPA: Gfo/Idh/MocA family oxidoreductase [Solirubrobacterales bacterium]|nr:Gfo/Idh/MocA family oxidoreductase [Solirubrobacterales bacterium]